MVIIFIIIKDYNKMMVMFMTIQNNLYEDVIIIFDYIELKININIFK